jgi:hypothetical protein
MSEYSPPNWTEPLPIYNPVNFATAQTTNGGGGGGSGFLNFPVAQGSQTMKNTLVQGTLQVSAGQSVNMGANIVQNAGTPVNPTDLATKAYVDLNAGTQNLQSVLTAGNTTGNFHISHADNYGDIYNGNGGEEWVVACDPIQFSSTATNDLYLASNAIDNFVRMGSYSGSVFSESGRIGSIGTGEKRAIFAGTLNALCIEDNAPAPSKGTSGQFLSCGTGGSLLWASAGGGGAGTLDQTLALGNTATGTYANITLTDTSLGGSANPILTLNNTQLSTGAVAVELYKSRTGVTNDIVGALNFYGKDASGNKTQFGGIENVITSAGGGGGVDGSLDFYTCVNGGKSLVWRLNGADNENNSFRPLDMNGNNITSNSGSLSITTASSAGTGTLSLVSKTGATASLQAGSSVSISALAGSVSTTATTGITTTTTAGGIINTASAGDITLTATSGGIELTAGGSSIGIQTNQVSGARSILRTGFTNAFSQNLDYIPSYVITNTGTTTNLTLPYIPYQNLTLVNEGVNATYNWTDVGDVVGTPTAFYIASSGLVWVGADNQLKIYANLLFSNPPLFVYGLSGGATIECFHEAQGFMFIGGNFAGITSQPQNQFNLMRFAGSGTSTPAFDPAFNSSSGQEGFNGQIYAITSDNNNVYVGGNFTTTFPSAYTLSNLCIVGNPYGASGSQTYSNDVNLGVGQFSTNGIVYAMSSHNNGGVQNIYVGGNFTEVAGGFQLIAYGAVYEVGWTTTPFSTLGGGNFNSLINNFAIAIDGTHMLFTGSFNFTEGGEQIKYGGYSSLASPTFTPLKSFNIATIGASGLVRNCINLNNGSVSPAVNFFITDDRQVWFGTDINAWEDGGVAFGSGTPAGIIWNGTNPYVLSPSTFTGVRIGIASTANATFVLPSENFRTTGGTFSKAILPEYTSQQFVADSTGTLYIPVGTPISTFSN